MAQVNSEISSDVFVSYSRKDTEFVKILVHRLAECDRTYWIDWQDILPLSTWRQDIEQGIIAANHFVFVMSPDSLDSDECLKELDYAIQFNKSLVPIVCRDLDHRPVHPSLKDINWIFFCGGNDFETGFQKLLASLDRNLAAVKAQTRLLKLANDWDLHQRDDSCLLRGKNLESVETWLHQQENFSSGLIQIQRDFLAASRVAETQRQKRNIRYQRLALGSAIAALTVVITLGILTEVRRRAAIDQAIRALTYASTANLALNNPLEALQQGVRANRQIQKSPWLSKSLQVNTLSILAQAAYQIQQRNVMEGHRDWVYGVDVSPDGQILATASLDGQVRLWQSDGALQSVLPSPGGNGLVTVSFSPDGQTLAAGGAGQNIYLWNRQGDLLQTLPGHDDWVTDVQFSPGGEQLASASVDGTVRLWQRDGTPVATLRGHQDQVMAVSFSPTQDTLASGSLDGSLRLWQTDGTELATLDGQSGIYDVAFSPDGSAIATASEDGAIRLWSPEGDLRQTLQPIANGKMLSVAFNPDGQFIAAAGDDWLIRIWQRDGTLVTTLTGHQAKVQQVVFAPEGPLLASVSEDMSLRLWQWEHPWMTTFRGHQQRINSIAVHPHTDQIVSGSQDGTLILWSPEGQALQTLVSELVRIYGVAISPDGRWLAGVGQASETPPGGLIQLWRATGEEQGILGRQEVWVNAVTFSPDSQSVASASNDGLIQIRGLDGPVQQTFDLGTNALTVAFSPNGEWLAAGGEGALKVWQVTTANLVHSYSDPAVINSLGFSPDSQTLIFGQGDRSIGLWPLHNTEPRLIPNSHQGEIYGVQFSPDGHQFASAAQDNMIRLWTAQGDAIATIGSQGAGIRALHFSSDGSKLISGSQDHTLSLWDLRILNRETLVSWSCDWLNGYLQNNPRVESTDNLLCQGVPPWTWGQLTSP